MEAAEKSSHLARDDKRALQHYDNLRRNEPADEYLDGNAQARGMTERQRVEHRSI